MEVERDDEEFKTTLKSGLYFKDLGNEDFEKGNYEAAITNYTKAIVEKLN